MAATASTQHLESLDIVAIVAYFIMVLAAGFYAMYRSRRSTVSGYFLAGRFMTWIPVGASIFASNIGSEHFIGLAGSGAAAGIAVGAFEFNAMIVLQLLGFVFLPVYIASKVCTLPEYMSKRFGGKRIRMFLAVLSLVLYIFTKLAVNLFSGAIFIRETIGWNLYVSTVLLLLITCICTVTGGLTAVIYTDTLQFFVMIIGGSILMFKSFAAIGGIAGLKEKYELAIPSDVVANSTCGYPRADSWSMLRDPVDSDLPWVGFLLGQLPVSVWYWCADQMMVQRALSAKSLSHAQGATLFAGYMKVLPMFMMVFPGMISRVLYTDVVACSNPDECFKHCESRTGCSNLAYPKLIMGLMPAGLRGVMFAVMLAALMSDLTSVFNSASTLFTIDLWRYIRPSAKTRELLIVGKSFVFVMVVVSIAWIPVILQMQGGQLYLYIQAVAAYLSPPIAAIYLVAILVKRLNETGAFWSMIIGFVFGLVRMGLDFLYPEPICGEEDLRPFITKSIHYMYFATFVFWMTVILSILISLASEPPLKSHLVRTTFWTRFDDEDRETDNVDNLEMSKASKLDDRMKDTSINGSVITIPPVIGSTPHLLNESGLSSSHMPVWKKAYNWFCGYSQDSETVEEVEAAEHRLMKLSSLEQKPNIKLLLQVNLVIILVIGIGVFVVFTFVTPTL